MTETKKKVILLVGERYRRKVRKISDVLNKPMSSVTEEAIEGYHDFVMYSPDEFWKFVKKNVRLSLYLETLQKSFKEPCCKNMFKDIMLLDEISGRKINFTKFDFKGDVKKFSGYLSANTDSVVVVIRTNPDADIENLANKISDTLEKTEGDGTFSLHNIIDEDLPKDKMEVYLFSINKG